jgi:hypothetical protein
LFVLTGDYSTPEFRRRFAEQARQRCRGIDHRSSPCHSSTASQVEQLWASNRNAFR